MVVSSSSSSPSLSRSSTSTAEYDVSPMSVTSAQQRTKGSRSRRKMHHWKHREPRRPKACADARCAQTGTRGTQAGRHCGQQRRACADGDAVDDVEEAVEAGDEQLLRGAVGQARDGHGRHDLA